MSTFAASDQFCLQVIRLLTLFQRFQLLIFCLWAINLQTAHLMGSLGAGLHVEASFCDRLQHSSS